jgi:hypothetical protein
MLPTVVKLIDMIGIQLKQTRILTILIVLFGAAACEIFIPEEYEPVYTPVAPTMTIDPCSPVNISEDLETIRFSLTEFQEITLIANKSRVEYVANALVQLQEIRTRLTNLPTPGCMGNFRQAYMYYTGEVIRYLTARINDPRSSDLIIDQQNSIALWQIVEEEYQKIALTVQQEFIPLTGRIDGFEEELKTGITALNDGNLSVNIRSSANIKSSIIGRLEPGRRALVLERNEAGDWIQINLKGIIGWVYFETVELIDSLD